MDEHERRAPAPRDQCRRHHRLARTRRRDQHTRLVPGQHVDGSPLVSRQRAGERSIDRKAGRSRVVDDHGDCGVLEFVAGGVQAPARQYAVLIETLPAKDAFLICSWAVVLL
ncbi:MAG: hypothetical protein WKF96_24290 [Solirubrobacteraceae bacterium]